MKKCLRVLLVSTICIFLGACAGPAYVGGNGNATGGDVSTGDIEGEVSLP